MKINLYSIFSYQSSIQLVAQSLKQMSPKTIIIKNQTLRFTQCSFVLGVSPELIRDHYFTVYPVNKLK